jgi:cytochrome c oxidase subunit 4
MDHSNPESINKPLKAMIFVFIALLVLTVITVLASYLHMLSTGPAIALALFIAVIKGSLVAAYFMHLIDEKKLVYWVLIMCVLFFIVMMGLPLFQHFDEIKL